MSQCILASFNIEPASLDATEKFILRRLVEDEIIGGRHTSIDNLKHGVPSHMKGEIEDAAKKLIKHGYLVRKPTGAGLHVYVNPEMIPEIRRILEIE